MNTRHPPPIHDAPFLNRPIELKLPLTMLTMQLYTNTYSTRSSAPDRFRLKPGFSTLGTLISSRTSPQSVSSPGVGYSIVYPPALPVQTIKKGAGKFCQRNRLFLLPPPSFAPFQKRAPGSHMVGILALRISEAKAFFVCIQPSQVSPMTGSLQGYRHLRLQLRV